MVMKTLRISENKAQLIIQLGDTTAISHALLNIITLKM